MNIWEGLLILVVILFFGCQPDTPNQMARKNEASLWYPVKSMTALCSSHSFEVYEMDHNRSWRSWPYHLDKVTKTEIELNDSCIFHNIVELGQYDRPVLLKLSEEQKLHIVWGFQ